MEELIDWMKSCDWERWEINDQTDKISCERADWEVEMYKQELVQT